MKVQGYAVELACSFHDNGPCDHEGVVAVVFTFEGQYVGQSCGAHLYQAMRFAEKEIEATA